MEIKKSNPYAAITVLVLLAILFMGYWTFVPIYATIHGLFHDDSLLSRYDTQEKCEDANKYWVDGACSKLSERSESVITQQRTAWLAAPFIFALGLVLWYWTKVSNKDTQGFERP